MEGHEPSVRARASVHDSVCCPQQRHCSGCVDFVVYENFYFVIDEATDFAVKASPCGNAPGNSCECGRVEIPPGKSRLVSNYVKEERGDGNMTKLKS